MLGRLVSQMSIEERLGLLEKIRRNSAISQEPLYVHRDADVRGIGFGEQYKRLSWFVRAFYRIVGLCTNRDAVRVFEDGRIRLIARDAEAGSPGVFDYRRNQLLDGFFLSLTDLKQAARFFYNVLDTGANRDRGTFYAILGSLEMEDIHLRLQNECGPQAILASDPGIRSADLRHAVMRAMDETLQSISDMKRGIMYYHARSLGSLKDLSCFLFDRFILAFRDSAGRRVCRITPAVKELMLSLDGILSSLRDPPSALLLESLLIHELEARAGEPDFDVDGETESLPDLAGKALAAIRLFNARIPLTRIIRCVTRNVEYAPEKAGGGEDWFQMYRNYWKRRLETELAEYFARERRRDMIESLEDFFGTMLEPLPNAASEKNPNGFPLPEAFALSFLRAFHSVLNNKINCVLQRVVMEGEFKRREDKARITAAYNDAMLAAGQIHVLDMKLAPTGEYGKRYEQMRREADALPAKRRKIRIIQSDASGEAWDIISRSKEALKKIGATLETLSGREASIENGGISNFDRLAGKRPAVFVKNAKEAVHSLKRAIKVLDDISEAGQNP